MELSQFSTLQNQTLTVSQLTDIMKELIEGTLPAVTVEGEISNWKPSSAGHVYFTLKDKTATLSAVMWRGRAMYLNFQPRDGMQVRVKGRMTVYPARGNYQIQVDSMEQAGAGDILAMLEERKRRLAMEGLFDSENKKPLPFFPRRIGVVTTPTGAGLRDICQIVRRRNPCVSIVILPAIVQGAEAASTIVRQIQTANRYDMADVLIVGRGGGSIEDLLPFSEEEVVRAVAASKIPVVSAVGHEIDWAISDFAADVRAPTPSAAAELCTPLLTDILTTLSRSKDELIRFMDVKIDNARNLVRSFSGENLELRFRQIEQPVLSAFSDAKEALLENMKARCDETRQRVEKAIIQLEAADPKSILNRGFAMVRDKETGKIIRSPEGLANGQLLEIIPKEGKITAAVTGCER